MVNGDVEIDIVDEFQRPWRYAFAVAGLLACWRLPEINLAGLSLDRCLDVITADLELPSGLETSLPVLQAANRDVVVDRLTQAAKKSPNTYTAVHALTMMGHLGYSEFLSVLVEALNWDFEESRQAAASAMDRFGETAIEYLDEHFDDYKGFERVMMTGVAARMATPSAIGFMDHLRSTPCRRLRPTWPIIDQRIEMVSEPLRRNTRQHSPDHGGVLGGHRCGPT